MWQCLAHMFSGRYWPVQYNIDSVSSSIYSLSCLIQCQTKNHACELILWKPSQLEGKYLVGTTLTTALSPQSMCQDFSRPHQLKADAPLTATHIIGSTTLPFQNQILQLSTFVKLIKEKHMIGSNRSRLGFLMSSLMKLKTSCKHKLNFTEIGRNQL